ERVLARAALPRGRVRDPDRKAPERGAQALGGDLDRPVARVPGAAPRSRAGAVGVAQVLALRARGDGDRRAPPAHADRPDRRRPDDDLSLDRLLPREMAFPPDLELVDELEPVALRAPDAAPHDVQEPHADLDRRV